MNKTSSRGKCCHSLVCVKQDLKPGWADHQFPSHHPLRLERGPAAHTVYEIREESMLSTSPRMEESPKKKKQQTDALLLCPVFLFTDLNLQISCWEINYSNSYSNIPQMNQKWSTLLHHKIKTTWRDVCKSWRRPRGFQQRASITSPTAPLCRQE